MQRFINIMPMKTAKTTAIQQQTKGQGLNTLRDVIESPSFGQALAKLVPNPQRFVRIALNQVLKNRSLVECDKSTFISCLLQAAQFGIEPNGRDAHLIPYRDRKTGKSICTLILDYKGMVKLALASGYYRRIHADVVCENDNFEYDLGVVKKHTIDFKKDRGKPVCYYALAEGKDGSITSVVMSVDEVNAVRRRSPYGNAGPWVTDEVEMSKKTAVRRLSKWIMLTPEAEEAIQKDAENEFGEGVVGAIDIPPAEVPDVPVQESERGAGVPAESIPIEQATDSRAAQPQAAEPQAAQPQAQVKPRDNAIADELFG